MKYSQLIGFGAALLLIGICFLPWSFIASLQLTITGFHAEGTDYGKPGLFNTILCLFMLIFFMVPAIWAKRTNVFIAALNFAWAIRNYLLLSACMMGECPEKKTALYILPVIAFIILLMSLLPRLPSTTLQKT